MIRRAVKDVKSRGAELDKKRKMKGKAYDGVKSKIARNIKVVDRVNYEAGYRNPHLTRRPKTTNKANRTARTEPMVLPENYGQSTRKYSARPEATMSDQDRLRLLQDRARNKQNASMSPDAQKASQIHANQEELDRAA